MDYVVRGGVQGSNPKDGTLTNLRATVQLLAACGEDQIAHFLPPDFAYKADEMAGDFDNWSHAVPTYWDLTDAQHEALARLNNQLATMSGSHHPELWTDQSLLIDAQWDAVRSLARRILDTFGWEAGVPPCEQYEWFSNSSKELGRASEK